MMRGALIALLACGCATTHLVDQTGNAYTKFTARSIAWPFAQQSQNGNLMYRWGDSELSAGQHAVTDNRAQVEALTEALVLGGKLSLHGLPP